MLIGLERRAVNVAFLYAFFFRAADQSFVIVVIDEETCGMKIGCTRTVRAQAQGSAEMTALVKQGQRCDCAATGSKQSCRGKKPR